MTANPAAGWTDRITDIKESILSLAAQLQAEEVEAFAQELQQTVRQVVAAAVAESQRSKATSDRSKNNDQPATLSKGSTRSDTRLTRSATRATSQDSRMASTAALVSERPSTPIDAPPQPERSIPLPSHGRKVLRIQDPNSLWAELGREDIEVDDAIRKLRESGVKLHRSVPNGEIPPGVHPVVRPIQVTLPFEGTSKSDVDLGNTAQHFMKLEFRLRQDPALKPEQATMILDTLLNMYASPTGANNMLVALKECTTKTRQRSEKQDTLLRVLMSQSDQTCIAYLKAYALVDTTAKNVRDADARRTQGRSAYSLWSMVESFRKLVMVEAEFAEQRKAKAGPLYKEVAADCTTPHVRFENLLVKKAARVGVINEQECTALNKQLYKLRAKLQVAVALYEELGGSAIFLITCQANRSEFNALYKSMTHVKLRSGLRHFKDTCPKALEQFAALDEALVKPFEEQRDFAEVPRLLRFSSLQDFTMQLRRFTRTIGVGEA